MATGVLPVFVGQATRAVSFAESGSKEYVAGLHLGCVTNTQDTSGEVLEQHPVSVTRQELEALLPRFTGELMQVPPMYSAIKINGQKLYELARQGKEVARPPRPVTIYELEVLGQDESGDWLLRILCSKGTYVRTLCHDIGQALGCGGCMSALRRTMAAGFTLADCHTLEEVQSGGEALLSPTDSLFRQYPAYTIPSAEEERRCRCGNPLTATVPDGLYRIYGGDGAFLCLSRAEGGVLTSQKTFSEREHFGTNCNSPRLFDGVHRGHGALLQKRRSAPVRWARSLLSLPLTARPRRWSPASRCTSSTPRRTGRR